MENTCVTGGIEGGGGRRPVARVECPTDANTKDGGGATQQTMPVAGGEKWKIWWERNRK